MNFFNWWLALPAASPAALPPSEFGRAALVVAIHELGHGESIANNVGPDLDRYRRGGPAGAWCAALVSFCLEEGALALGRPCPVKRSHGAKTLFERCVKAGVRVETPLAGDIACLHRGAAGARTGHIFLVARDAADGGYGTIEGNRGTFPSPVRRYDRELGEPLLLGFARLP
jgi:hypothetical protein